MIHEQSITHTFRPGETVEAIIKKVNCHDVTASELLRLVDEYRRINGDKVPRAGTPSLIPVLTRHQQVIS